MFVGWVCIIANIAHLRQLHMVGVDHSQRIVVGLNALVWSIFFGAIWKVCPYMNPLECSATEDPTTKRITIKFKNVSTHKIRVESIYFKTKENNDDADTVYVDEKVGWVQPGQTAQITVAKKTKGPQLFASYVTMENGFTQWIDQTQIYLEVVEMATL
jgi:hypothetical protein